MLEYLARHSGSLSSAMSEGTLAMASPGKVSMHHGSLARGALVCAMCVELGWLGSTHQDLSASSVIHKLRQRASSYMQQLRKVHVHV